MNLPPADEERASRARTSRRLFLAGVAVLVMPVAGLAAKRLFDRYFPAHAQDRFAKVDLQSLPSLPKLPDVPPPPTPDPVPPPAAAPIPPQRAPVAQKESVVKPEVPKPPVQAQKAFKPKKLRRLIGLSEMNLGSRADYGTTPQHQNPPDAPKVEPPPPAAPKPAPAAPEPKPAPQAKPAAPPKPAPPPRRVYSAPIPQAQLKIPPAAPTSEEVAVQPDKAASPQPVEPGSAVLMGAPDTPPPPNPERPLSAGGPCPHAGWWKNTYADMCYATEASCRGSSNGNGDCVRSAAPVGPCAIPGRCQPKRPGN